jgi:hypothetical protein
VKLLVAAVEAVAVNWAPITKQVEAQEARVAVAQAVLTL